LTDLLIAVGNPKGLLVEKRYTVGFQPSDDGGFIMFFRVTAA